MNANSIIRGVLELGSVALFCAACQGEPTSGSATATAAATAAADPTKLAVGAAVIASSSPNSFTEGKVTAIEGTKVTYEYGDPDQATGKRSTSSADAAKVFLTGLAPKSAPKVGDYIVAKMASGSWTGCEVKTAETTILGCEDWNGKVNNVDPKTVVVVDPITSADIKGSLTKSAKNRKFDDAAKNAGKPVSPAGWKPKVKEAVIVPFAGSSWYGGTVEALDGAKVTIKWDTTVWKDPAVKMLNEIVAVPTGVQKVTVGQFIIVPPKFSGSQWEYRKVVSVTTDSAEVLDTNDEKSTVSLKTIVPVAP